MSQDNLDKLGSLMNEIGGEGARIVGGEPDGMLIYGEVEEGAVFAAVYKNESEVVRYYDQTSDLADLLIEAWETGSSAPGMRWSAITYEVNGRAFHVDLTYPEQLKPGEDASDRRQAALKKRYGNKAIVYPPIPDDMLELRRD